MVRRRDFFVRTTKDLSMPLPTTIRRSFTRYRRPTWLPEGSCVEREIPISSKRWFQRTQLAGEVVQWTFSGFGCHPVTVHQHNESEAANARRLAGYLAAPCSHCQPLITHMDLPLGCNAMIMPTRVRHALRGCFGRIVKAKKTEEDVGGAARLPNFSC